MRRIAILACVSLLGASACRPPSAVVTLSDPDGLTGGAVTLMIGDEEQRVAQPLGEQTFPVQVTLTDDEEGDRLVIIDAVAEDGVTVARAAGVVAFSRDGLSEVGFPLGPPCHGEDGGEETFDSRCDDGVFCNGYERCVSGVCRVGVEPCPQSAVACVDVSCLEAARTCVTDADNARCDADSFCDAQRGCTPGEPCDTDAVCDDGSVCNGAEFCEDGRCRQGLPLVYDDENDCTLDACSDGSQDDPQATVGRINVPLPDGNQCDLGAGNNICVAGACVASRCGDGVLDDSGQELCDDGNALNDDDCVQGCKLASCGDGFVHALLEACDDANVASGDGCSNDCKKIEVCGDGVLDAMEECDDGNARDDDDCVAGCVRAFCGDSFAHAQDEACDDGNTQSGDGCQADCSKLEICGDQTVDTGELCDDGADGAHNPNDGCDACADTFWTTTIRAGLYPAGGIPTAVALGQLGGIAQGPDGWVYASGRWENRVWRLLPDRGRVLPFLGDGMTSPNSADVEAHGAAELAAETSLTSPGQVTVSPGGVVYVVEEAGNNDRVRAVFPDGTSRVVIGGGAGPPGGGQPALDARFASFGCLSAQADEKVLVCSSNRVTEYDPATGRLTTVRDGPPAIVSAISDGSGGLFIGVGGAIRVVQWFNANGNVVASFGSGDSTCAPRAGDQTIPASQLCLPNPQGLFRRGDWLLVADRTSHTVHKIKLSTGDAALVIGVAGETGSTPDGLLPSRAVNIDRPSAVFEDEAGNVWFTDSAVLHRVRRISPDGELETMLGGERLPRERIGPPLGSAVQSPRALHQLDDGRVLVADSARRQIYGLAADGETLELFMGDGTERDEVNADAHSSSVPNVTGIASTPDGTVYVSEGTFQRVYEVAANGSVRAIFGVLPDGSGEPTRPLGLDRLDNDSLLLASAGTPGRVLRVFFDGSFEELWTATALTGAAACPSSGRIAWSAGGQLLVTDPSLGELVLDGFFNASDVTCDDSGDVYASRGGLIRRYTETAEGVFTGEDYAGVLNGGAASAPGVGRLATRFSTVRALARTDGGLLVTDNSKLRHVPETAPVTTLVARVHRDGSVAEAWAGAASALVALPPTALGQVGSAPGTPFAFVDGRSGHLKLLHLDDAADGVVRTIAGYPISPPLGVTLFGDEPPAQFAPLFANATGVAYDPLSTPPRLFVADRDRHAIYEVDLVDPGRTTTWRLRLFAGTTGIVGYTPDGLSAGSSLLSSPAGLAVDAERRALYVAEAGSHIIRRIDLDTQLVSTVVGSVNVAGNADDDAPPSALLLRGPEALAVTQAGDLYIADTGNHQVRFLRRAAGGYSFSASERVLGDGQAASGGDGPTARTVLVDSPAGVATDSYGNLFVSSRVTLRVVTAGGDGVALGDDAVQTIYGVAPRLAFPLNHTRCVRGVALGPADDRVVFTDACRGLVLEAVRGSVALP